MPTNTIGILAAMIAEVTPPELKGDRLWPVQPGKRPVPDAGQRDRGWAVGSVWSVDDILRRSSVFLLRLDRDGFARAVGSEGEICR